MKVIVKNDGQRPATNVRALLPSEIILSVISFTKADSDSSSDLIINTGEAATLVLGVNPAVDHPLEEKYGTIVVQSEETSVSLSYR